MRRLCRAEFGVQIGWTADRFRLLTGSIGALESAVVMEVAVESLAALSDAWDKLGQIEAHKEWSKEIEPYVVSGTPRWQIYRVV